MIGAVLIYRSWYKAIKELPEDKQLKVYIALMEYGLDGTEPELDGISNLIFDVAKPLIDSSNKKRIDGAKGGAPAGNKNAEKQQENNQKSSKKQPKNNHKTTTNQPENKLEKNRIEKNSIEKSRKEKSREPAAPSSSDSKKTTRFDALSEKNRKMLIEMGAIDLETEAINFGEVPIERREEVLEILKDVDGW